MAVGDIIILPRYNIIRARIAGVLGVLQETKVTDKVLLV